MTYTPASLRHDVVIAPRAMLPPIFFAESAVHTYNLFPLTIPRTWCLDLVIHYPRESLHLLSRWTFECYQKEQLAAYQLRRLRARKRKDLLFGCTGRLRARKRPAIIVWANGGFGPTSRRHAPAPNKRLRRLLSKYMPVIISSEYCSSQRSACCHGALADRPSPKRVALARAQAPVKQCTTCKCTTSLLSRDVSAGLI